MILSTDAEAHLVEIFELIAARSSSAIAKRYVDDILGFCATLADFLERGMLRDDLGHPMRVIGFRRRVAVVFEVAESDVLIAGIFCAGADYAAFFSRD